MQIACKYRSLSRYRSKRSLSFYISLSRYVFFSRFHCTCPFLSDTLSVSLFLGRGAPERRNQSRDKVSADEIVTEFFSSFLVRSLSTPRSGVPPSPLLIFEFFDSPRCRRIYETPYVSGVQYADDDKNISSQFCWKRVFGI